MKKSYYIIIHFGIAKPVYVTGFIIPVATDKNDALEQLKTSLKQHDDKINESDSITHELSTKSIKEYLWSLNRPDKINERNDPLVQIIEITKPIVAGYWLQEIGENSQLCNTRK